MKIFLNEEMLAVEDGTTLRLLRQRHCPQADIIIVNGHPVSDNHQLADGDSVIFISKGLIPPRERMEALMAARHSPLVHDRMKRAKVGIAGLGGLGSSVAVALARMGVGTLVLADGDVVEPSNLNRQCYFTDQIGRRKVEALGDTLARVNPFCGLELHPVWLNAENVPLVFAGAAVVVEAFDRAEAKVVLIDAVLSKMPETSVVAASGVAGYDSSNAIRTRKMADRLFVVGDLTAEAEVGRGLMAPRVGIAAHHQANAVVRLLMGDDPAA